jgi:hypothetical protein
MSQALRRLALAKSMIPIFLKKAHLAEGQGHEMPMQLDSVINFIPDRAACRERLGLQEFSGGRKQRLTRGTKIQYSLKNVNHSGQ